MIVSKYPDAELDFAFDWTDWLAESETIDDHTVTVQTGLTLISDSETDGVVTAWISGGTAGRTYTVACLIETNANRIDERTMRIQVMER